MTETVEPQDMFATVDPELARCPYPQYQRLREERPVQWLEGMGAYAVTRYEDIMPVLQNAAEFSSARNSGPGAATNLAMQVKDDPAFSDEVRSFARRRVEIASSAPVLVNADPPVHTRQRRLLNKTAFTTRRVDLLETSIQELTDRLIDGFAGRGHADLIAELALPLPMTVIARALGIEGTDLQTLKRYSDAFVRANGNPNLTHEDIETLYRNMNEAYDFFGAALDDRAANPRDDLISVVAHAEKDGEGLSRNEQLQIATVFLIGGNETTMGLIGSSMLAFMRDDALRARLIGDPESIPTFVEEVLRLEPPTQGMFRIALKDCEVGGVAIPAGSFLWLIFASGNRDAACYPDADTIVWDRVDPPPHLSFGGGAHFCMGSALARAEARIAIDTLLRRLPDVALAPDESADQYLPNLIQHGLVRLNATFTPQ